MESSDVRKDESQSNRHRRKRSSSSPNDETQSSATPPKKRQIGLQFDGATARAAIEYYRQKGLEERAAKEKGILIPDEAERLRREALSPQERLKEDGREMQQRIEADRETFVVLEVSASEQAKCYAEDDCLKVQVNRYRRVAITDEYRISLRGLTNDRWFGRTTRRYHVRCFAQMIDLKTLIPSKFILDRSSGRWPLMVELWFKHAGCIDKDVVAAYMDAQDTYFEAYDDRCTKSSKQYWDHQQNCVDKAESECKCPPLPDLPSKPKLENYTTEEHSACELDDVLEHPGCRYTDQIFMLLETLRSEAKDLSE